MKIKSIALILAIGMAAVRSAMAQSGLHYTVTPADDGNAVISWKITGEWATPQGAELSTNGLNAYTVSWNGVFYGPLPRLTGVTNVQTYPLSGAGTIVDLASTNVIPIVSLAIGPSAMNLTLPASGPGLTGNVDQFGERALAIVSGSYLSVNLPDGSYEVPIPFSQFGTENLSYNVATLQDGLNVTVYIGAVPEPATMALAGLGAAGLVATRRRR